MLNKKYRIHLKKDFQNVFKERKVLKSSSILIKYTQNDLSNPRIAFIVSNKVNKLATRRNYIKRICRNIVKDNLLLLPNKDIIVIALKEINSKKYLEVRKELDTLINKIK